MFLPPSWIKSFLCSLDFSYNWILHFIYSGPDVTFIFLKKCFILKVLPSSLLILTFLVIAAISKFVLHALLKSSFCKEMQRKLNPTCVFLRRFDLIFLMLDPQDEAYDRRLAHHLVSLYYRSEEQVEEEFLDMAVLRDYIAYARTYISPRLSEEASQALIEVRSSFVAFVTSTDWPLSVDSAPRFPGLCGHEEARQRSRDGHRLPQAAGVSDSLGRGPR